MRDFKFLKFLDLFRSFFEMLGVEYPVMRRILQIKFLMDSRRVPTILNTSKNTSEEGNNNFLKSLGLYLIMGLILIPLIWMKHDYFIQMSIVFAITLFFIMSSLISDFSAVLLDIKDKSIIGTKPVKPKTLQLTKMIHIFFYLLSITGALVGPSLIVSIYRHGVIFFTLYFIAIILIDLLSIVLTSFIYLFILKFFDGERLKDLINYIQIFLTIGITLGYQVFIRLYGVMDLKAQSGPAWWQLFAIPIWFAAPFQMLMKLDYNINYIVFTIMAVAVPLIAFTFYIKLIPIFEKYLQKLSNHSDARNKSYRKTTPLLPNLLCRSKEERVFFRFTCDMMKKEREFKLKVYPSLGFAIVFPYIFLFQYAAQDGLKSLSEGKLYFFIYLSGIMLPTVMWMIRYSSNYKGAWIYQALPVPEVGPVFRGAIKAFIVRLFLPLFVLQAFSFILIFGTKVIPDLLVALINILIFNLACFIFNKKSLPFSEAFVATQQMDGMTTFVLLLGLGGLAALHLIASAFAYGSYIYFSLAVIAYLVLWNQAFKITADKLNFN